MSPILLNFGKNLKKFRVINGYTQEQLAEKLSLSVTYISLLENGKRNTTLLQVEAIAKILNLDVIELFKEFDKKK